MKITINGKTIELPVGLTAKIREIIEAAEAEEKQPEPEKKSPFERAGYGETYYYISGCGEVEESQEDEILWDERCNETANYCTDRALMEQRALHETLNRLLWRYSEEHGGDKPWDWKDSHWCINKGLEQLFVDFWCSRKIQGVVYFPNEETAQAAIREIVEPFMKAHPDFVW